MTRVAIAGGGITGLAAAWHLHKSGAPLDIVLLEKSRRPGGCIHTERHKGFIMEHGPDVFLARKPDAMALCGELGLSVQETAAEYKGAYLRHGQKLFRLPEGLSGLAPTRLGPLFKSPLLSVRGKLRMLLDLLLPPRPTGGDESVAAFFERRLGREAFERLIASVLGGIAGGDPRKLSMAALFPQVVAVEQRYGSVLAGLSYLPPVAVQGTPLRSLPNGMSSLVEALEARLGSVVRRGAAVADIRKEGRVYVLEVEQQEAFRADVVILAVPVWYAAPMVKRLDAPLADELGTVNSNAIVTVHVAFDRADVPHSLDAYGYLVAGQEASPIVACTWSSSKLAGRAPEDQVLLRLFLAGPEAVLLPNREIKRLVRRELQLSLKITASPHFTHIYRLKRAMPQFELGHNDRIARIQARLARHSGFNMAGPIFSGIGIPDCIRSGTQAAEAILERYRHS